jgi:hypothetical protein
MAPKQKWPRCLIYDSKAEAIAFQCNPKKFIPLVEFANMYEKMHLEAIKITDHRTMVAFVRNVLSFPCKYFMKGNCPNGTNCTFSHQPTKHVPKTKESVQERQKRTEQQLYVPKHKWINTKEAKFLNSSTVEERTPMFIIECGTQCGVAFLCGNRLLTAAHVVAEQDKNNKPMLTHIRNFPETSEFVKLVNSVSIPMLYMVQDNDLAYYPKSGLTQAINYSINGRNVARTIQSLAANTFVKLEDKGVLMRTFDVQDPKVVHVSIDSAGYVNGNNGYHKCQTKSGHSGAPVFNLKGSVIGVHVGYKGETNEFIPLALVGDLFLH